MSSVPAWPQRAVAVIALLLACLVFVPNVSVAGSWASSDQLAGAAGGFGGSTIPPAQLAPPGPQHAPALAHALLLILLAIWSRGRTCATAAALLRVSEPLPAPGRRGRAVLQAFLN
jgi:hypothetical protein